MREIWSDFFRGLFFQERTSKLHYSSEPVQLYGTDIYKDVPSVHLEFCHPCRCHFFYMDGCYITEVKKAKRKPPINWTIGQKEKENTSSVNST